MTAATVAQIDARNDALLAELLADAEICQCHGEPLLSSVLAPQSWVDTDLHAINAPHRREDVASFLDRAPTAPLGDSRFRVQCRSRAEAVSVAALLRHLGAPVGAITIGGGQ